MCRRETDPRGGPAADAQRRDASPESRTPARDDRVRGHARRTASRGRACPVLRLGAAQPPCAVPDLRGARARNRDRRGGACPAQGHPHHRLCRSGLLCAPAESLHGRLGAPVHQYFACGPRAAVPRRRDAARFRLAFGQDHTPQGRLVQIRGVQPLSRHVLDAGTVPLLRAARDRLGRLPLPGFRIHRRRVAHRPRLRLHPVAAGRCGGRGAA